MRRERSGTDMLQPRRSREKPGGRRAKLITMPALWRWGCRIVTRAHARLRPRHRRKDSARGAAASMPGARALVLAVLFALARPSAAELAEPMQIRNLNP